MEKGIKIVIILFLGLVSFQKISNKKYTFDIKHFFIKDLNNRDFSIEKLNEIPFDTILNFRISSDFENQIKAKYPNGNIVRDYYYYSVLDTSNYYSFVLYRYHEYYRQFEIFNISKENKIIDVLSLSSEGGDDGYFFETNSKFLNDTLIKSISSEGEFIDVEVNGEEITAKRVDQKIEYLNSVNKSGKFHPQSVKVLRKKG